MLAIQWVACCGDALKVKGDCKCEKEYTFDFCHSWLYDLLLLAHGRMRYKGFYGIDFRA